MIKSCLCQGIPLVLFPEDMNLVGLQVSSGRSHVGSLKDLLQLLVLYGFRTISPDGTPTVYDFEKLQPKSDVTIVKDELKLPINACPTEPKLVSLQTDMILTLKGNILRVI